MRATTTPWFALHRHDGEGEGDGTGAGEQQPINNAGGDAGAGGSDKTFTQADLDRIVTDRLARQKAQYADYDDLKTKATKHDEHEAAQLSELERERAARETAEQAAQTATEKAQRTALRAEVMAEAAKAGAVDPADVFALLDPATVTIADDGAVTGAAAAVAALLEAKPHLKAAGTARPGPIDQGARGAGEAVDYRTADKAELAKALAAHGIRTR